MLPSCCLTSVRQLLDELVAPTARRPGEWRMRTETRGDFPILGWDVVAVQLAERSPASRDVHEVAGGISNAGSHLRHGGWCRGHGVLDRVVTEAEADANLGLNRVEQGALTSFDAVQGVIGHFFGDRVGYGSAGQDDAPPWSRRRDLPDEPRGGANVVRACGV